MAYSPDDLIQISALSHACYCARRFALVHLEGLWAENRFTAEGEVLHERVHSEHAESRKTYRQEYDMAVRSLKWGLIGKCDLVEIWYNNDLKSVQKVNPVEFKRGREKESDVDRVQLCAQCLCLEEMFSVNIAEAQLYYLQEHRRSDVLIDTALRQTTGDVIKTAQTIWNERRTPQAVYEGKKCDRCSLVDLCMPRETEKGGKNVERYMANQLRITERECNAAVA
jgi:CRISPR-associated exonuclease Cas4